MTTRLRLHFCILGLFVTPGAFGGETTLVVPESLASVEGAVPSDVPPIFPDGDRLQFVLPADAFASLPASHRRLVEIGLRPDAARTEPIDQQDSFLIRLSTTDRALDGLSETFADNAGSDETIVYDGPLELRSALDGPAEGPRGFDLRLRLQTPFDYDPAAGNLLIDIVERGPRTPIALDLHAEYGLNGLFAASDAASVADAPFPSPVIAMIFVPEPSTVVLAAVGLIAFTRRSRPARALQSSCC